MHELLLFGQIPAARHEQLLNMLAGVSAMQPHRILERHVLFKPERIPTATVTQQGGSQMLSTGAPKANQKTVNRNTNADVYYVHLVKRIGEDEFGQVEDLERQVTLTEGQPSLWELQYRETPAPGKRSTILRMAENTELRDSDPQSYMKGQGFSYHAESVIEGHRFISGNIILLLHRVLLWPTPSTSMKDPLPAFSALTPLDKSGGYVLEAKVRIGELNPTLLAKAEAALISFRDNMKGVVEMVAPERLAMDTRALATRPRLGAAPVRARG